MPAVEEMPKIKGTPVPTPDGAVKGQKRPADEPAIVCECRACGYGNSACAGYFTLKDTPLNQARADKKENVPAIMCPACRSMAGARFLTNDQALRTMEEDVLRRRAMMQEQEIAELRKQLAAAKGEAKPEPKASEHVATAPEPGMIPRSGQRR